MTNIMFSLASSTAFSLAPSVGTYVAKMQRSFAVCQRTESSIAIITAASADYPSYAAFYSVAIDRLLREWWDVDPDTALEILGHAQALSRIRIDIEELQLAAESLLQITPIPNYECLLPATAEAFNIRNDWNFREYGWVGDTEFGLLVWQTSA